MFVDYAEVSIKAGKGGDGKVSFHREKYVSAGGPDGGDGGKGGNVIFVIDGHLSTLLDFKMKRKYVAMDGAEGGTKKCSGKDGGDIVVKVPRGTLIRDAATGALLKDMWEDEPFIAARGGRGGWGNTHFATPTRQAPRFSKPGLPGEERRLILELKLIADVGFIGFPNVGKSTLLSVISAAKPKIANYHFTTLSPNLGVVYVDEGASFVAADIPGIIEGAAQGAGLGHDFLRHIDRCRLLVHIVDISGSEGRDPLEDMAAVNEELKEYSKILSTRPQILVANKADILMEDSDALKIMQSKAEELDIPFYSISAATRQGVDKLVGGIYALLQTLPPVEKWEADPVIEEESAEEREILIDIEDGVYYVTGAWVKRLTDSVNFGDYESRMYFERALRNAGVFRMLEEMGIRENDTVNVLGEEFDYVY